MASREDPQFLAAPQTVLAIREASRADKLVIYCGAGVSIDRTGVSWKQLITELFAQLTTATKDPSYEVVRRLLDALGNEESASIAVDTAGRSLNVQDEQISKELQALIYRRHGWSQGLVLVNLATFCLMAALTGKDVTIVTTNYDTHIEQKLASVISDYMTGLRPHLDRDELRSLRVPGVRAASYRQGRQQPNGTQRIVKRPRGELGWITVHYPHGRLPENGGGGDSRLVLTEANYATSHLQTASILERCLEDQDGQATTLLIVGASVTDRPLVEVLAKSRLKSSFALLRLESWLGEDVMRSFKESDRAYLESALDSRGHNIGVSFLKPRAFYEIAQFFEELRLQLELNAFGGGATLEEAGVSYEDRLTNWEAKWTSGRGADASAEDHRNLSEVLDLVRDEFGIPRSEQLRLEVWIAHQNSDGIPHLRLLANTSGPLTASHVERVVPLRNQKSASVAALNAGRPLIRSLDDLDLPNEASRWRAFFSVPIFLELAQEFAGESYSAHIPAGVVTLASTESESALARLTSRRKEDLVDVLIDLGGVVLGGPAIHPARGSVTG